MVVARDWLVDEHLIRSYDYSSQNSACVSFSSHIYEGSAEYDGELGNIRSFVFRVDEFEKVEVQTDEEIGDCVE